ncbi:MAG: TetR family transcriptional regulator [bacterium]|nr:TetR family transcriptional regulator [bacterium]
MSKSERTKQTIVAAALELFREHGYEATTMRMVAKHAGVSVGNAYYYFKSKDVLLQAFYREVHDAEVAAAEPALASAHSFRERLRAVLHSKLEVIEPYHRFSALMFRSAADPKSPLNPFHPDGRDVRRGGEALFARVVDEARPRVARDLAAELPGLLWTYSMSLVLFWIHDDSPERERSRAFVDRTTDLIATAVRVASNPLMRPLRKKALDLVRDLTPN